MTAELGSDKIHGLPNRFEFRDVRQVVIEREDDITWLVHIDGAIVRLKQTSTLGSIVAALTQLPPAITTEPGDDEPAPPAEPEVKPDPRRWEPEADRSRS